MSGFLAVAAIVLVFAFLAFVFWASRSRWLAERGWIYNKHNPHPARTGSLGLLETIYQPSMEHVIDERSSEAARGDQDDSGDDPEPGEVSDG
ncbi:MAG: hypothetical protein KQH83_02735 [Actinobacteria bacterium]|nr:hypothetical protein [Actinomycetota bacterium]